MSDYEKQIDSATDDFFNDYLDSQRAAADEGVPVVPVDTWQMYADARAEYAKKSFPNGATKKFGLAAESVLDGLKRAHTRSKMNIDNAKAHGDKMRARLWSQQYMEDYFMPAVDSLVLVGSADELLGMSEVLKKFDELALVDGASGKGYTEALIRSMYDDQLGSKKSRSDAIVRGAVKDIMRLVESGNIREATGKASKILDKINLGENAADDSDYDILQKIVARAQ